MCPTPHCSPPLKWLLFDYSSISFLPEYPRQHREQIHVCFGRHRSKTLVSRRTLGFYLFKRMCSSSYHAHMQLIVIGKLHFLSSSKSCSSWGLTANLVVGLFEGHCLAMVKRSLLTLNIPGCQYPGGRTWVLLSVHAGVYQVFSTVCSGAGAWMGGN